MEKNNGYLSIIYRKTYFDFTIFLYIKYFVLIIGSAKLGITILAKILTLSFDQNFDLVL